MKKKQQKKLIQRSCSRSHISHLTLSLRGVFASSRLELHVKKGKRREIFYDFSMQISVKVRGGKRRRWDATGCALSHQSFLGYVFRLFFLRFFGFFFSQVDDFTMHFMD